MRLAHLLDSFSDELTKIARRASARPVQEEDPNQKLLRAAGGAVAPTAAGSAMLAMTPRYDPNVVPDAHATNARFQQIQEGMGLKEYPIDHMVGQGVPDAAFHGIPEKYRPEGMGPVPDQIIDQMNARATGDVHTFKQPDTKGMVFSGAQPHDATMAHELGHIKNYKKTGVGGQIASGLSRRLSTARLGGVPALPAATSAWAAGQEDPSWTPGVINAAVAAPMMADEAAASAHAVKYMTKRHGLAKGLWKSKNLAPAFGTYAAIGATPLAITGGRKLLRRHKANKEKKAGAGMTGAAIGGLLGAGLTKGPKGALAGAAIGGLAGAASNKFNKTFIEEPGHRRAALSQMDGYTPTWARGQIQTD